MTNRNSGSLDGTYYQCAAWFLGTGVGLGLLGYGWAPLLVMGGVLKVAKGVFKNIEDTGSPL